MKVYGPYTRKDGRQMVVLYDGEHTITMSYPKFLVEEKLGRILSDTETIDHLNGDFTDNDFENIRIVERAEHAKDDVIRIAGATLTCQWCDTVFECSGKSVHDRSRGKAGPFCGKSCSGKYGASLQRGKVEKMPPQHHDKVYYKNKTSLNLEPVLRKIDSGDGDIGETFDNGNAEGTSKEERRRD